MQLFHKFQNHPEGVVADSTAQTWTLRVEIEKREQKLAEKRKRRDKKDRKQKRAEERGAGSDVEMVKEGEEKVAEVEEPRVKDIKVGDAKVEVTNLDEKADADKGAVDQEMKENQIFKNDPASQN